MKNIIILFLLFAGATAAFSQKTKFTAADLAQLKSYEDTLGLCSFLVINDSLPEERFVACKKVITTLVKALKTPNSFHYPFERMKAVSIQYPPDSTFRVFTWQLYVDVDDYRYFGTIQMNNSDLKMFPLIDRSADVSAVEYDILSPEKWYGALYYNIRQFDTPEGRKYLLFGYDGFSFFDKRKVVDVLSFTEGKAVFGAPVFIDTNAETGMQTTRNRLLKEYSAEATFKLNYDESYDIILYDHLVMMGGNSGQGPAMVPDGTYEGYELKDGRWHWIEKYFNQTMDEAPRPEPILDGGSGKDILGKARKN